MAQTSFNKILLIQFKQLGDVLMTTPALRAFRAEFPQAHLCFLTGHEGTKILDNNPNINEIIVSAPGSIPASISELWRIRKRRFDVAVDFESGTRSAQFALFSGAPLRIGFRRRWRNWIYHRYCREDRDAYSAFGKLQFVAELGINPESYDCLPELHTTKQDKTAALEIFQKHNLSGKKVVAFSPVSRRPYKRWPYENFANIAERLIRRYQASIMVFAGPGEYDTVSKFISHINPGDSVILPPAHSIGTAYELFAKCCMFVGNDNGLKHIAVAAGTPTFVIFSKYVHPLNWTPGDRSKHRYIVDPTNVSDEKRSRDFKTGECLLTLSREHFWDAVADFADLILG
jgi:heptosyltransferase-3